MKQTRTVIILGLIMTLSAMGCQVGSVTFENVSLFRTPGKVIEESRPISDISGVHLATLGDLAIKIGETETLVIEAEDTVMKNIETQVIDGVLKIKNRNNTSLRNLKPVYYTLTVKSLDSIVISSSGNIEAPNLQADQFSIRISSSGDLVMGDLKTSDLTINLSSSGNMRMGLFEADTLDLSISSSGDLDILGGEVASQLINISSSGNYSARDLASEEADVRISSSGSATIFVTEQLVARLSSSGDLYYLGDPQLNASSSSSGDIKHLSD